jgi:hypothetical protein
MSIRVPANPGPAAEASTSPAVATERIAPRWLVPWSSAHTTLTTPITTPALNPVRKKAKAIVHSADPSHSVTLAHPMGIST